MTETPRRSATVLLALAAGTTVTLLSLASGASSSSSPSRWIEAFGYSEAEIHSIEIGEFGYPFVPARIGGVAMMLPFDTGNMVGVSISEDRFEQLGLTADRYYRRRNSTGELVGSLRVAEAVDVSILGRDLGPTNVFEMNHPSLPGLIGPTSIMKGHFTLDYGSRRMGLGETVLPETIPGFQKLPLVRSARHPMLILVHGTIEGRRILIELDTGKSRSVINPGLASELGLKRVPRGVAVEALRLGDLTFAVSSAKEVDQKAIGPDLQEPVLAGVGSDILSQIVWTVDYDAGFLWIPVSP